MFTSKELFGLEAELRTVHDNAGAEVARQCAIKMGKMEEALRGVIGGFTPSMSVLKALVGHTADDDIFAGREHWRCQTS